MASWSLNRVTTSIKQNAQRKRNVTCRQNTQFPEMTFDTGLHPLFYSRSSFTAAAAGYRLALEDSWDAAEHTLYVSLSLRLSVESGQIRGQNLPPLCGVVPADCICFRWLETWRCRVETTAVATPLTLRVYPRRTTLLSRPCNMTP